MEEVGALIETGGIAAVELAASALAERGETIPPCPSCTKPMIGPFCAVCGQPRNTHRRSLGRLAHEFVKDVVSFDSRILRTTRALLFRPGELPIAFREGRTQPYVPAVRLYLFVSLLFFLFLSATGIGLLQFNLTANNFRLVHDAAGHVYKEHDGKRELMEGMKAGADGKVVLDYPDKAGSVDVHMVANGEPKTELVNTISFFQRKQQIATAGTGALENALKNATINIEINGQKSSKIKDAIYATLKKLRTDPGALNEPLTAWIPRILFVLLPLFALLLALFYRAQRKDYLFVDHLIFSLTMHTFAFVALIGAAVLAQVMAGGWVANLYMLVVSVYFFLSLKFFYRQGWWKTGVKFVSISLVYFLFFLCPALGFALVASVIGA